MYRFFHKVIKKREIKKFLKSWRNINKIYRKYCPKNRMAFPEPLQKTVLMSLYDNTLELDACSSYDFKGNVEMKSSVKCNGGCTPFSKNQNNCCRIIYVEIVDHFDIYEISDANIAKINTSITNGHTNISLKNYLDGAKKTRLV